MLADFRKCDKFYCHFVTSTWQLPKSMFRISARWQLVCSTGDLQCRVPVQTYKGAAYGPTTVRYPVIRGRGAETMLDGRTFARLEP